MTQHSSPLIIAHRGFHQNGIPENSVEAIRAANDAADGVEFDIRESADGILVVHHDSVAFGLPIATTKYSTLHDLSKKNGATIPTLEEVVAVIEFGKFVMAEVKVGGIAERVGSILQPKFGERFRIGSFRFSNIANAPTERRWLIVFHALQAWPYRKRLRGIDFRRGGGGLVKRWGLESSAWTVNTVIEERRLIKNGVQYITTDDPRALREGL